MSEKQFDFRNRAEKVKVSKEEEVEIIKEQVESVKVPEPDRVPEKVEPKPEKVENKSTVINVSFEDFVVNNIKKFFNVTIGEKDKLVLDFLLVHAEVPIDFDTNLYLAGRILRDRYSIAQKV